MSTPEDLPAVPDNLRHYSLDEVAETVSGITEETYVELWETLAKSEEAGTAKPLGGDGAGGTTEEPIVSDGHYGSDLVSGWPHLSPEARANIVAAAAAM
jgi:hypothetical protein